MERTLPLSGEQEAGMGGAAKSSRVQGGGSRGVLECGRGWHEVGQVCKREFLSSVIVLSISGWLLGRTQDPFGVEWWPG